MLPRCPKTSSSCPLSTKALIAAYYKEEGNGSTVFCSLYSRLVSFYRQNSVFPFLSLWRLWTGFPTGSGRSSLFLV